MPSSAIFAALACVAATWLALSAAVVVVRLRRPRAGDPVRLARAAARRGLGDLGRRRRVEALRSLVRSGAAGSQRLLADAVRDADPEVVLAAVRLLGELGTPWAIAELGGAMRDGPCDRARIAAEIERQGPAARGAVADMLDDPAASVRLWGATLAASAGGVSPEDLARLASDDDRAVRAAAVETLGLTCLPEARPAVVAALGDADPGVRVNAARALPTVGSPADAGLVTPLLADARHAVRAAAKESLRAWGGDAVPALLAVLASDDAFARNGAAEVLQDVGFLDALVRDGRDPALVERIGAAGGGSLLAAARARAGRDGSDPGPDLAEAA